MKKTRLVTTISMCVLCLSFLVVGVWAVASSVNFSLSGNLQFYPEGVYVELSGQVYRGDSVSTLEPLTSDPRFTLENQTNFDNSTGEPSGNFPMESWNIQNLTFTPTDRFIKVEVKIKNHSSFPIVISPNVLLNNEDISSSTFTNLTITESEANEITASSGETVTYYVMFEIDADATQISGNNLSLSFDVSEFKLIYRYALTADLIGLDPLDVLNYFVVYDDAVEVLMDSTEGIFEVEDGSILTLTERTSNSLFSKLDQIVYAPGGGILLIVYNTLDEEVLSAYWDTFGSTTINYSTYTVNGK